MLQDLKYALRQFAKHPGFAGVVVGTLGLGIGANTAMFSLATAALLQSPPVHEPERLVAVYTTCRAGQPRCSSSYPDYRDYRDRSATLTDLAAYTWTTASLGDDRGARLVTVQTTSGNYFPMLAVGAGMGRLIVPDDDRRGGARQVAVLSQELWRDRFGGDSAVVGRTVRLNGAPFEVIGVLPLGFRGLHLQGGADVYVPFLSGVALGTGFWDDPDRLDDRGSRWIAQLVGRMAAGVTIEQVRTEMLGISAALAAEAPEARGPRSITVDPLPGYILPEGARTDLSRFVILLVAVVGFALMLACANLANLFLSRAAARRRELGVRLALGAGRGRLVRQLITESVAFAVVGGAAGVLVAAWALSALRGFDLPGGVTIGQLEVALDARMLGIAAVLSLLTGVAFGIVPALQASSPNLVGALKDTGGNGGGRGWTRHALVALQVAMAFLLLVGSGLFLRTLINSLTFDPGFASERVALARFNLSLSRHTSAQAETFTRHLLDRLANAPGVEVASLGTVVPFQPGGFSGTFVSVAGYDPAPDEEMRVDFVFVAPDYFRALGIPVVAGRGVEGTDDEGGAPVVVVNETAARQWWPNADAVTGRLTFAGAERNVVGVVGDTDWRRLGEEATPFVFLPIAQFPAVIADRSLTLAVRSRGDPVALLPLVRSEVATLDPDVSLVSLQAMRDRLAAVLMPQRLGATLLTLFALLAVVLAVVGIYGVVSFNVSRDRRNIGIRMALGALRRDVLVMVMRRMIVPVSAGLAVGLVAASLLARGVERFLFGVGPRDLMTYAALALLLFAVAILAAAVPARRATRIDPMEALRYE